MRVLDRRTFLRGAGGVGIALPFLEAMLPRHASAQTAPRRYVVCFAGMSLGRDNAGKLTDIVPDRVGAGFDLKLPLAPLAPGDYFLQFTVTGPSGPVNQRISFKITG